MPKTTDILNRIITFKDLYGSASTNTITFVTRSGDTFEDGTFSTIMSNTYQTLNFYAGQPGKWLNVGGSGGGSTAGLTTVSNNLTTVSNSVVTNMGYLTSVSNAGVTNTTNINTVSNSVVTNMGYLTSVSNSGVTNTTNINTVSNSVVTNMGYLTSVSNAGVTNTTNIASGVTNLNTVSNSVVTNMGYLTSVSNAGVSNTTNLATVSNTVAAGRFPYVSANTISTSLLMAGYVSSPQGYISSLVVDALSFSLSNSFISMGDIITTSVSTIQTFTSTLTTNNLRVGTVSTLSYIAFSGLQQGYNQTVIAEQATASGIQELLIFRGSTNTDRIRMQTTGPIVFEPGVSARTFPATGSNATPAMIINTSSNVGIGVAAPTVSLDVAGAGRFTAVSTNTVSTNIVNAGYLVGQSTNTATTSVSPLAVVNGGANTTYISQIEFQFNGGGYKHFMGSRHNDSWFNNSCNAIDFWLFSGTGQNASTKPGTCNVNTMSVTAAGVGICNLTPSVALDVAGAGKFTSNLTIFGAGFATNAATWTTGTTHTLYGDSTAASTKYIQWAYNNTPGTTIADGANMNIACPYVGINQSAPTVALDVAGAGRFTAVSTQTISTNQLNSSNICNVGWFSNVGNLSNGGSAYFFSNGSSAASPSTTNVFPYATFKINSASANTLSPVVPLLLMTGGYGGSIAGGLTQSVGPILSLGTVDGGLPSTIEGYRLTGSNSAFYGKVDMQRNNISNVSSIYGCGNTLQIYNSTDINVLCGGNLYMYTNPGQYNGIYNGTSYVQIDPSQNINISSAGNIALNGNTYTYSKPILIKNDTNHGLVYGDGTFRNIATDGPFLFGFSAGALGITDGGNYIKLNWDRNNVNIIASTIKLRGTVDVCNNNISNVGEYLSFHNGPYLHQEIPGGYTNAFLNIIGAGGDGQLRLINGSAEVALRGNSDLGITPTSGYNIVLNGPTSVYSNINMCNHDVTNVKNIYMNNTTIYNAGELYNNNTDLLLSGIGRNVILQTFSGGGIYLNGPITANYNLNMNGCNISNVNVTTTAALSTNTISTNTLTVGGSALSARLGIQSNATTLTSPASVIITIPNMSYFFDDYTNLTNYITISNYGAQNGDYINVVNTGNSGTPATFQILDGSTGVSTNIRYIYPGHAGVVAYSGGQWWPM
jgi:hypothetical protein